MKVEVREKRNNIRPDYPYLGILECSGHIALFISEDKGISICGGQSNCPIGEVRNLFELGYTPYTGEVVLSND